MKLRRWHAFVLWALGSLLAIALLEEQLLLGLGIAVLSGVAFGAVNWLATRQAQMVEAQGQKEKNTV